MNLELHLENFDGPLDLLLHLVKETKMDIYEINMAQIIENYLAYINSLQELNIDINSEFLVMAATLIHLKSKKLIGKQDEENSEDEYAIASEEELKMRIIEYEKYKNITRDLQELELKRKEIFTKLPENLGDYKREPELINEGITVDDLLKAWLKIEERLQYKEPIETRITKKEISVQDRMIWIRDVLKEKKRCPFEDLFDIVSRESCIATFLAILEMCKQKEIGLEQQDRFGAIWVERIV